MMRARVMYGTGMRATPAKSIRTRNSTVNSPTPVLPLPGRPSLRRVGDMEMEMEMDLRRTSSPRSWRS